MKHVFLWLSMVLVLVYAAPMAQAQTERYYDWTPVSIAGPLTALDLRPTAHFGMSWISTQHNASVTLDTGTNTVCTWQLEGSDDGVNWAPLQATTSSCTAPTMETVLYYNPRFVRIDILTYTGTASLIFHWTGK